MKLEFVKMSGAGNDFIVLDNRDGSLDGMLRREFIARICRRGLDIGADGLLELRTDDELAFMMKYYNSDGGQAEMCGNGGRCIAYYAAMKGMAEEGEAFSFRTVAGVHRAVVLGPDTARIWMTEPEISFLDRFIELDGTGISVSFIDTGVPHAVVLADSTETPPFESAAPLLRRHPAFGAAGANVDYLWKEGGMLRMRTWERGVEGETLACGTGAVACAICANRLMGIEIPVDISVRSGERLTVGMDGTGWWLEGEARLVYSGTMETDPSKSLTESH